MGTPVFRIGMFGRIGHVPFPVRTGNAQLSLLDPAQRRCVRIAKPIVRAAVYGEYDRTARQLAILQLTLGLRGFEQRHAGFYGHQRSDDWIACQGETRQRQASFHGVTKDKSKALRKRRGDLARRSLTANKQEWHWRDFFAFNRQQGHNGSPRYRIGLEIKETNTGAGGTDPLALLVPLML